MSNDEEGINPEGTNGDISKKGILAEVGAISLVAIGAFIGKLLFSDSNTARDTVVITTPGHNRQGYRHRKNNEKRKRYHRSRPRR
jgi:hypothetical protein